MLQRSSSSGIVLIWITISLGSMTSTRAEPAPEVRLLRVPDGGIQPQVVVGRKGTVHLLYYKGDAGGGDLFYVKRARGAREFSTAIRVNSQPGSAVAKGNIRGGQIALGGDGRLHVAWNGSTKARPKGPPNPSVDAASPYNGLPMLYSRSSPRGDRFEPQRCLMQKTFSLDGGGTVAADGKGGVYVAWHANDAEHPKGEEYRRVYLARSTDEGATFDPETPVSSRSTGACGCCGMRAHATDDGNLYLLYRGAQAGINRGMYLISSGDSGRTFRSGASIHRWQTAACPMSSESFASLPDGLLMAWESKDQVYYSRLSTQDDSRSKPIAAPGKKGRRRFPSLAVNARGHVLLAWTVGMAWKRGGRVAWQVFDGDGESLPGADGSRPGVPVWSLVAAFVDGEDRFTVMY